MGYSGYTLPTMSAHRRFYPAGVKLEFLYASLMFLVFVTTSVFYLRVTQETSTVFLFTKTKPVSGVCTPQMDCFEMTPALKELQAKNLKPVPYNRTIYIEAVGRLGNILCQFSFVLSLARATCATVKASTTMNIGDIFEEVPFDILPEGHFNRLSHGAPLFHVKEKNYNEIFAAALQQDIRIHGVKAYFSHLSGCSDYITDKLRLNRNYRDKGKEIFDNLVSQTGRKNVTTIGIHVRRTDKLGLSSFQVGVRVPNMTYFSEAMTYFRKKYPNVLFIVTTDDRLWVRKNFLDGSYPDVVLVPNSSYLVDFVVLTLCDHVIQSIGTFGQWAAYLSSGTSIYFRDRQVCPWSKCDPTKYKPKKRPEWPGWIPIPTIQP